MSGALPGSVHDKKAEWIWGVLAELEAAGLVTLADKGYLGSTWAKVPYQGKNKPESQKEANRAHAKLRAPGERANAQLKNWRILRKLRCCPWRAGQARHSHPLEGYDSRWPHTVTSSPQAVPAPAASHSQFTARHLRTVEGQQAAISAIAFSPGGGLLAACDGHGNLMLWDLTASVPGQHLNQDRAGWGRSYSTAIAFAMTGVSSR